MEKLKHGAAMLRPTLRRSPKRPSPHLGLLGFGFRTLLYAKKPSDPEYPESPLLL